MLIKVKKKKNSMNMLTTPQVDRSVPVDLRLSFNQICGDFCKLPPNRAAFLAFQTQGPLSNPETGKYGGYPYSLIFGKAFVHAARQATGTDEMGAGTKSSYAVMREGFEARKLSEMPTREEWRASIQPFLQMLPPQC